MILIDSDSSDHSSDDVLDWLYYLGKDRCIHRNIGEHSLRNVSISLLSKNKYKFKYDIQNLTIDSSKLSSYWYRRGASLIDSFLLSFYSKPEHKAPSKNVLNDLLEENKAAFDALNHLKNEINPGIGNFGHNFTNKLTNLIEASKCGLSIPATLASNDKQEVVDFINEHKKVIVKNISQSPFIREAMSDSLLLNINFQNFIINVAQVESILKENFELTLFQKYIEKKIELRVFFLNDTFFTTAIFSQANEKTKIDYRFYDMERPNRTVPFNLPQTIKNRISKFMKSVNMNCGSIDLIYAKDNKFYFLEVNPIGQFQGNEKRCNFFISKLIASTLLKTNS